MWDILTFKCPIFGANKWAVLIQILSAFESLEMMIRLTHWIPSSSLRQNPGKVRLLSIIRLNPMYRQSDWQHNTEGGVASSHRRSLTVGDSETILWKNWVQLFFYWGVWLSMVGYAAEWWWIWFWDCDFQAELWTRGKLFFFQASPVELMEPNEQPCV